MSTHKLTVRIRLKDKHAAELARQARAVNVVWNYCNETQQKAAKSDRKWLSGYDLIDLTSGSSAELGLHSHTIQRVCVTYESSRRVHKKAWLRWRGRRSLGWVPFNTGHVSFDGSVFRFRGHTYEPMHSSPMLEPGAKMRAGSFNQDAHGHWYVNLVVDARHIVPQEGRPSVGIDLGLKSLAVLSDGTEIEAPRFYRASEAVLATAQRARKAPKRVRNIHAKIANRRKDFLHKASAYIANNYRVIVVGDVSPSKIAQTRMAKSVYDAGWASLKSMLSYKAIMHGGSVIEADERYSTQICSECGSLPPSRPRGITDLGIRKWTCDDCGAVHHRDVNAAKNILRSGLATLVEGAAS